MNDYVFERWSIVAVVAIAAVGLPFVVAAGRRKFGGTWPTHSYAPHLMLLSTITLVPRFAATIPPLPAVVLTAFCEAFVIWAIAVALSEWNLRRLASRPRGV